MGIVQVAVQSNGPIGPPPRHAISLRVRPMSAPTPNGNAAPGESRPSRPECPVPTNALDQTTGQSGGETHLRASAPTSRLSDYRYKNSAVFASFATLLLLKQNLVCCIDRLKPQSIAVVDD